MSAPASSALAAPIRVAAGTTAGAAVRDAGLPSRGADDAIVVVREADGRLRDLSWTPEADVEVTPVAANTDDGRSVIRHSAAHVLAQAVQEIFPEAKLGIGPPVTDGFYYDFDVPRAFTLSGSRAQRTAFLHVDYRKIALVEKEFGVDARIDDIVDRKIFVSGRLLDGDDVLAESHALFVKLKPGQP
jgi:hypothetical protein